MKNVAEFAVKTFNSGEKEVKLLNKLDIEFPVKVNFNWFEIKDIMVLFFMLDCLNKTYGAERLNIELDIKYFPYLRQERLFDAGGCIPLQVIENFLRSVRTNFKGFNITVMANHSGISSISWFTRKLKIKIDITNKELISVFPDESAWKHYIVNKSNLKAENYFMVFGKIRNETGVTLCVDNDNCFGQVRDYNYNHGMANSNFHYMIYDDICDGGRTFVECAKILKDQYYANRIELTIYHAFLTHGLDDLKSSGIDKIWIINPESYEYVCAKYPNDRDYFGLSLAEAVDSYNHVANDSDDIPF